MKFKVKMKNNIKNYININPTRIEKKSIIFIFRRKYWNQNL